MNENKHTPEPWHLCEIKNETGRIKHLVPVDSEKMSLLTTVENYQATFAAIYNDDDARRIVACVNACAGISTKNLWDSLPVKELTRRYNKALKQRDELLAAMIHIQQVACSGSPELGIATDAIASVKGEQ